MDRERFDSLVRALAGGMAGGGPLVARGGRGALAAADKVPICQLTGSETHPVVHCDSGFFCCDVDCMPD